VKLARVIRNKIATRALSMSRIGRPSDGSSRFHRHSAIAEARSTKDSASQATPEAQLQPRMCRAASFLQIILVDPFPGKERRLGRATYRKCK
jgi:hypothetical protein